MGGELFASKATEDASAVIQEHIKALRRNPALSSAVAVLIVESNMPMVAESIRRQLQFRIERLCVLAQDPDPRHQFALRTGTRTTRENKPAMIYALSELFSRRAVSFAHQFTTIKKNDLGEAVNVPEKFIKQLTCYKRTIMPPKPSSRTQEYQAIYKGKDDNGDRVPDDLILSTGFIVLNREVFLTSPSYVTWR